MPIRKEHRKAYRTVAWRLISLRVRYGWEAPAEPVGHADLDRMLLAHPPGRGVCAACEAVEGELHPRTAKLVVLTVAHLDHSPAGIGRDVPENLRALCRACHLAHDKHQHLRSRRSNRLAFLRRAGQQEFPWLRQLELPVRLAVARLRLVPTGTE